MPRRAAELTRPARSRVAMSGRRQAVGPRPAGVDQGEGSTVLGRLTDPVAALSLMFAVGGVQGLLIMAMPHWTVARPRLVVAVAVAGIAMAALIWGLRRRLGPSACHAVLATGTVAASTAVYGCGAHPASMSAAYFYFWIALFAAAYFRAGAVAIHLTVIGALYAAALAMDPAPAYPAQWLQAMVALTVTSLVVGGYAGRVRRAAAALEYQALHDPLTGLGNRAQFVNRLDRTVGSADSQQTALAVVVIDIDDFKMVNDSLGHPAGDRALIAAAHRLAAAIRPCDELARLGADEFAILLDSGPMPATAEQVAARIAHALEDPFEVGGAEIVLTASIGIAIAEHPSTQPADVLRDADLAVHLAKQNGKARCETIQPGMQGRALEQLTLLTDLRHALANHEFEVFYQPIFALREARVVGVEALLRWHHPRRGLVLPTEFVGAAETTGLIVPIGDWVLHTACRQAESWRRRGTIDDAFYVSVNLSPRQLAEPTLVDSVSQALRTTGLPPESLVLEITESTPLLDSDAGQDRVQELNHLGVRLALDDYGTGYSSMKRLARMPVDILKIDKMFIDNIADSPGDRALLRSLFDACRNLGLVSIAEGVERTDQRKILADLGCDAIQGYLIARPAAADDVTRYLEKRPASASRLNLA